MQAKSKTKQIFREKLESLMKRGEDKITQSVLAEATGLTQSAISNYLTTDRMPGAEELAKIAKFFGRPMEWFLGQEVPVGQRPLAYLRSIPHNQLTPEELKRAMEIESELGALSEISEVATKCQELIAAAKKEYAEKIAAVLKFWDDEISAMRARDRKGKGGRPLKPVFQGSSSISPSEAKAALGLVETVEPENLPKSSHSRQVGVPNAGKVGPSNEVSKETKGRPAPPKSALNKHEL